MSMSVGSDNKVFQGKNTNLSVGDCIDITAKDPTLRKILVGVGWELNAFEGEPLDLDTSVFLLNKSEQTREDEDFIFYNNTQDKIGAVVHRGDNRTGAGDGDDEQIEIELNNLSYDVIKIMFVISIYDPDRKGYNFSQVKNLFLRIVNHENQHELIRMEIDGNDHDKNTAMRVVTLEREGPSWIVQGLNESTPGGLAEIAKEYGILISAS